MVSRWQASLPTGLITGVGQQSLLKTAVAEGYNATPRGLSTREAFMLSYQQPLGTVETRIAGNPAIGVIEGLAIAGNIPWDETLDALKRVAPKTVEAGMFAGSMSAYADRLDGSLLSGFRGHRALSGRQAVGIISRNKERAKALPCTTSVQLRERDGKLHVNVQMRSQDLFLGYPADTIMWTIVGLYSCLQHGLEPGELMFQVSAPHVYSTHFDRVNEETIVEKYAYSWMPGGEGVRKELAKAKGKLWLPSFLYRTAVD